MENITRLGVTAYRRVSVAKSHPDHLCREGDVLTLCGRWAQPLRHHRVERALCAKCRRLGFNAVAL